MLRCFLLTAQPPLLGEERKVRYFTVRQQALAPFRQATQEHFIPL
jgi:hypothetical protein